MALTLKDIGLVSEALRLTSHRSKLDQQGESAEIAVPEGRRLKPKSLLLAWWLCRRRLIRRARRATAVIGRLIVVGFEATANYHRMLALRLLTAGFELRLISSVALTRTREVLHNH